MTGPILVTHALLAGSLLLGEDRSGDWPKLPATDGNSYTLSDFQESRLIVVVFTGNTCPVAADYNARLGALAGRFDPRTVKFVAINVADGPGESLDDMKALDGLPSYLYLKDEDKAVARRFNALVTPHVFVLEGRGRNVIYEGAIDDCPGDADSVAHPFLEQAIRAALDGRTPPIRRTTPRGCSILY